MQSACFAIASADQYAPTPLTAVQVLQKADAAGGDLQPGSYVEVEEDRSGGLDTTSTTHLSGDDWIEYDKTGPFTTATGLYRGQHWQQDENGIVTLLSRFRVKTDPNVLAWDNPGNPAYRVRVLGLTPAQPQEYVLEADPPGGSDQYRYYNAKTFLLDRVVTYAKDRHRHVTEFSDYRTAFGQTFWFRRTYGDGRPQNDGVDRVLSFAPEGADAASFAIPASHTLFTVGTQPVLVPVQLTKEGFVARVTIAGRGLDFLIDSGASDILLDPGVAHDLGIAGYGRSTSTVGGDFDTSLALVPKMTVGSLEMRNVAVKLGPMDERLGSTRIVGLLGFDFLASAIPCANMHAQTVTFYSRAGFAQRTAQFAALPMMVDDGVPRVPATFEGIQGWFLIDTGAFGTLLYENYLQKLPNAHVVQTGISGLTAVGGDVPTRSYAVSDFAFGSALFRNAVVTVPQISTFDLLDYDGIIGRDVLSTYEVCLDYANRQAFLRVTSP
jgi:hypothetical protein